MDKKTLKDRSYKFGLRVIKMIDALPKTTSGQVVAKQIVRCTTSVGANYRAACKARSTPEFIAKLGIVVEEIDECCYWLELVKDTGMLSKKQTNDLYLEANELTAIFTAACKTTALKNQKSKIRN